MALIRVKKDLMERRPLDNDVVKKVKITVEGNKIIEEPQDDPFACLDQALLSPTDNFAKSPTRRQVKLTITPEGYKLTSNKTAPISTVIPANPTIHEDFTIIDIEKLIAQRPVENDEMILPDLPNPVIMRKESMVPINDEQEQAERMIEPEAMANSPKEVPVMLLKNMKHAQVTPLTADSPTKVPNILRKTVTSNAKVIQEASRTKGNLTTQKQVKTLFEAPKAVKTLEYDRRAAFAARKRQLIEEEEVVPRKVRSVSVSSDEVQEIEEVAEVQQQQAAPTEKCKGSKIQPMEKKQSQPSFLVLKPGNTVKVSNNDEPSKKPIVLKAVRMSNPPSENDGEQIPKFIRELIKGNPKVQVIKSNDTHFVKQLTEEEPKKVTDVSQIKKLPIPLTSKNSKRSKDLKKDTPNYDEHSYSDTSRKQVINVLKTGQIIKGQTAPKKVKTVEVKPKAPRGALVSSKTDKGTVFITLQQLGNKNNVALPKTVTAMPVPTTSDTRMCTSLRAIKFANEQLGLSNLRIVTLKKVDNPFMKKEEENQ